MSTRSFIGKKQSDGKIKGIYAHWDGYPSGNGKVLLQSYKDEAKIDALLAEGNVSVLAAEIGAKHNFDDKVEGVCSFYGRDRGEKNQEAGIFADEKVFLMEADRSNAEYAYLFVDGKWQYAEIVYKKSATSEFKALTEEVCTR